jgi:hypothetical protein
LFEAVLNSDAQLIIQRLTEILEVDYSWYEECRETWEDKGDIGWIVGALNQADEADEVRAAAHSASVGEALSFVAMIFGWEQKEEDEAIAAGHE